LAWQVELRFTDFSNEPDGTTERSSNESNDGVIMTRAA